MSEDTQDVLRAACEGDTSLGYIYEACTCIAGGLDLAFDGPSYDRMSYLNAAGTKRITAKTSTALKKACDRACERCRKELKTNPNLAADIGRLSVRLKHMAPDAGWEMNIYRGRHITTAYRVLESSSHSCMTGENSYKTWLYAVNPDKVGLAVIESKGRVLARCIVWDGVETEEGTVKAFDRLYMQTGIRYEAVLAKLAEAGYTQTVYAQLREPVVCGRVRLSIKGFLREGGYTPYLDGFDAGLIDAETEELILSNDGFVAEDLPGRVLVNPQTTDGVPWGIRDCWVEACEGCGKGGRVKWRGDLSEGGKRGFKCRDCWEKERYTLCRACNEFFHVENNYGDCPICETYATLPEEAI